MIKLDDREVGIVRALIREPRASDNSIAKQTGIPVMTVNRKRKRLEEKGLLAYYAHVDIGEGGTRLFHARQLYVIQFTSGITRDDYLKYMAETKKIKTIGSRYVVESHLGEQSGRLALILIVEAETEAQLTDIFNGEIIQSLKKRFGDNSIHNISTAKITFPLRLFHNYIPFMNMEKGKIKKDWPDDWIFTDIMSKELEETKNEHKRFKKADKQKSLGQHL